MFNYIIVVKILNIQFQIKALTNCMKSALFFYRKQRRGIFVCLKNSSFDIFLFKLKHLLYKLIFFFQNLTSL